MTTPAEDRSTAPIAKEGSVDEVVRGEATWCVVHGDALHVLGELPDGCVDAFVADPPYSNGAGGMAFTEALVAACDHTVALVDRQHAPGGHWNDAYPFVRLHQPSAYYGVNSVPLGDDRIDTWCPKDGVHVTQRLVPFVRQTYRRKPAGATCPLAPACSYILLSPPAFRGITV